MQTANKRQAARGSGAEDRAPRERGGIQSLERAFAILEAIAREGDGIGLAELSKAVGLHNSTAFHLAKTMAQLGYVDQDPASKRYRVGSRLFALAAGAQDETALLRLATPVLEDLTAATGESAHFAIRAGRDVVVIARTEGAGLLRMAVRAGAPRPAHATALGKVLVAALGDEQIRRLLGGNALERFTPRTIVGIDALLREIATVRRTGVAYDDGEFDAEVRCVAVPVRDFTGRVAGAIGVSGPVWRLSLQALQGKAKQVAAASRILSTRLGYVEKDTPRAA